MIPAVRSPYCAGSAPVSSENFSINRGDNVCPKPDSPSGRMVPLIRYCRLP